MYWTGISEDVKTIHTKDAPYVQNLQEQYKKETLKPTETLLHSWDKLGLDIFQLNLMSERVTIWTCTFKRISI